MPGNWKLDAIITALGDKGDALPAHSIAEDMRMSAKQLSNYFKHNVQHKYVDVIRVPAQGGNTAPWINYYTLTEQGWAKYRRITG